MASASQLFDIAERYGTWALVPRAMAQNWSASEFERRSLRRLQQASTGFRFARLFDFVHDPERLDGFERDMLQEWGGDDYRPGHYVIPWSELRGLNVATASAGGYLVETENLPAADILRPWSVSVRAGVTVLENLAGDQALPKTTAKAVIHWLQNESTAAPESTPTLAQSVAKPKLALGIVQFSRQLTTQSGVEAYVRRELTRTAATAIDQALFAGTGASGQPLGLMNTPGIGTQSGTSIDRDGAIAMRDAIAGADGNDESISFVGAVDVRTLLAGREVGTDTGRYVWDGDRLADRAARVTTDIPGDTLIAGDWPHCWLLLWGPGLVVELDPFTGFQSGIIQARVLVSCDVLVAQPSTFVVAGSVT